MGIRVGVVGQKTDVARKWGPLPLEDVGEGGVCPCHKGFLSYKAEPTCFHFPVCLQLCIWNWAFFVTCTVPYEGDPSTEPYFYLFNKHTAFTMSQTVI